MTILVINTGSSSIKYELFDMNQGETPCLLSGIVERIGEEQSELKHKRFLANEDLIEHREKCVITDHHVGLQRVGALIQDEKLGALSNAQELSAVGHRVVHGGEDFTSPTLINAEVIEAIRKNVPLAPLHNPPNLIGIEVAQALFSNIPHVAVFDTAFHQTLPEHAYLYALPRDLYQRHKVRRYGFHGTSHSYVAKRAADQLGRTLAECNLITIHLGNGASVAAIKQGQVVDTSMGMTPLEGLVMGTRCGDVDPALPFFLARNLNMSLEDIDALLNKESGLKGLCGKIDMRDIVESVEQGDAIAQAALEVYSYRIKKYIGAYGAVVGPLDAIIFTAGIGENVPLIRQMCIRELEHLGIELDPTKNQASDPSDISTDTSSVKILVVPTNEELEIAQETQKVLSR